MFSRPQSAGLLASVRLSLRCETAVGLQALPFAKKDNKAVEKPAYPQDLLTRLSSVPVYAVANRQNEFILVAAEVCLPSAALPCCLACWLQSLDSIMMQDEQGKETGRNMLLGFMCEADAHALSRKVASPAVIDQDCTVGTRATIFS